VTEKDAFAERGRSLEEQYFRKKDRELIEKMKQAAAAEEARREMGARTGLSDPEMLNELEELGFTPETVSLLPLVPVVQVAWAEGGVTNAERALLTRFARARGIEHGSPADLQLQEWISREPDEEVFRRAGRLIRAMLDSGYGEGALTADELVKYCEDIAAASGGILGLGRISGEEREILTSIASTLKTRQG
jgi:hypothetical protein